MKNAIKTILSLSLIIVFLMLCMVIITSIYTGLWLHTYNVFTEKTKIADIELSELRSDSVGEYIDVKLTEYNSGSALESFFGNIETQTRISTYKVYGDSIYIGGPTIKFKDELVLLNFKTVYKLSKLYGRYSDNTKEINKPAEAQFQSSYDLNNGYEDWKVLFENYRSNNFLGQMYRLFIDYTQLSEPGQFASNEPLKYELYVNVNGFNWELVE